MSHGAKAAMGSDELCVNIETHIYILSDTIRKPEADTAIWLNRWRRKAVYAEEYFYCLNGQYYVNSHLVTWTTEKVVRPDDFW